MYDFSKNQWFEYQLLAMNIGSNAMGALQPVMIVVVHGGRYLLVVWPEVDPIMKRDVV